MTAFSKYLTLSDNNSKVALNFFNKAYNEESAEIKEEALKRLNITVEE